MSSPSSNGSPLLLASSISKSYRIGPRTLEVLKGVSLAIQAGEFVALRGASGAGKSTLLHLLGGLDRPDGGTIHLDGHDLAAYSASDLARLRNERVGLVFQAYHLLPELSALENVCLPGRMARHGAGETEKRARSLLARVGLADRVDHRPYELSGGEQQRVAIARALINSPTLLLADEPTGNLDSATGGEIIRLLRELQGLKATLVIATHDNALASIAPRVVELADGRLLRDGPTAPTI
jgi:putative ABC transport system ATP-binding protein